MLKYLKEFIQVVPSDQSRRHPRDHELMLGSANTLLKTDRPSI